MFRLSTRATLENCKNAIRLGYDGISEMRKMNWTGFVWIKETSPTRARHIYGSGPFFDIFVSKNRPSKTQPIYIEAIQPEEVA